MEKKNQDRLKRWLPSSAGCRLNDGVFTPEALSELFGDWQRAYEKPDSFYTTGFYASLK
jgi:hypothetical protein